MILNPSKRDVGLASHSSLHKTPSRLEWERHADMAGMETEEAWEVAGQDGDSLVVGFDAQSWS